MQLATKTSILFLSALGLAACDGATEPFAFDTTYTTFADISDAFEDDVETNVDEDGSLENPGNISSNGDLASMPSGSTIYNGALIAEQDAGGGTLIGQLQLDADFTTNRIDGRAGNFIDSSNGIILGSLLGTSSFTDDVDGTTGNHFEMELTGTLDDDGTLMDTTLDLEGNFLSNGGSATDIAGDADITMTGGPIYDEGAFSAAR